MTDIRRRRRRAPHAAGSTVCAILLGLALILPGCPAVQGDGGTEDTGAEAKSPELQDPGQEIALVVATHLKREPIHSFLEVSTDVETLKKVDLYPQLSGLQIIEVAVDEGDSVKKDQMLARLDSAEIELELAQAQVLFEESKQRQAKSEVAVKEAQEREKSARIKEEKDKRDYDKALSMFQNDLIAEDEFLGDRLTWEQSSSEHDLALLQKENADLDHKLSQTEVEKNRIAVETARVKLARTRIKAPFDGAVTYRNATIGTTVSGSSHLFTVVNQSEIVAHIYVPQEEIVKVKTGQTVEIGCAALPGVAFSGTLDVINPVVDPASGTVKLRAKIVNDPEHPLRPGMFITARVITASHDNALLIPRKAVFYDDEKPTFFAIHDDQTVRKIHFLAGASTDSSLEIASLVPPEADPVEEGTRVVIVGQDNLNDGDAIEVVKEVE